MAVRNESCRISAKSSAGLSRFSKFPFSIRGKVRARLIRDGKVIAEFEKENLVTDAGKEELAKLLVGLSTKPFTWIAVGTGTTEPSASDTALEAEITGGGLARAQDSSPETSGNTATISVTWNITGSYAITEAGLFNDDVDPGGVMLARVTVAALNVQSGDTLTWTWEISFN